MIPKPRHLKTRGNDAPSSSQQSYQKKKRVFNKTPNFSVWSLCDLHRRVISALRVAEVQRVACVAERDGLVAGAIHAGHCCASQTMACHLLILLANFATAIDGVGATADVLTGVVRLGHQLMACKCKCDIGAMSLPGNLCGYNWGGIKPQQISNNSSAPLHRCEFVGSGDALKVIVSEF